MARWARAALTETVALLTAAGVTTTRACGLVGLARSTYYRLSRGYRHYTPVAEPVAQRDRYQPAALTAAERAQAVAVLEAEEYADLSVVQAYWRSFDTGAVACSQRTFYRVAGAHGLVGDRRTCRKRRSGSGRVRWSV